MQRNFSAKILDLNGKPIFLGLTVETLMKALWQASARLPAVSRKILDEEIKAASIEPLTLADACHAALLAPLPGETEMDLDKRRVRFDLARRIAPGGLVAIKAEECVVLKNCVTKFFTGNLVPCVVEEMLEAPAEKPKTPKAKT